MSKPTFLLFPFGLTPADIQIGRLVSNPFAPYESYIPETPSIPAHLLSTKIQTNVNQILASIGEESIKASLTKLLKINYATANEVETRFASVHMRTNVLRNAENELPKVLADPLTQGWVMKRRTRGEKVFLVVGIKAFDKDASVFVKHYSGARGSFAANVPVTAAVVGAAGVPPVVPTDALDASIAAAGSQESHLEASFTASSGTIFAVEYREVKNYRTVIGGYNFKKAELGYAALPAGGQGIYYSGGPGQPESS